MLNDAPDEDCALADHRPLLSVGVKGMKEVVDRVEKIALRLGHLGQRGVLRVADFAQGEAGCRIPLHAEDRLLVLGFEGNVFVDGDLVEDELLSAARRKVTPV